MYPSAARDSAQRLPAPEIVVGRKAELDAIGSLLGDPSDGAVAVLLEGEPGIGKTTLWEVGVRRAEEHSNRVLTCRPAETEAALPFSALADLLEPDLDTALPLLPEPQRRALEVALLRVAPLQGPTDQLAVSRAVLGILNEPARGTTVLALDDVQWLDAPTAQVLEFALRRMGTVPIRLLLARRDGLEEPLPLGLERSFPVRRVHVGPLTIDELNRLVVARLGSPLPRPRLVELHQTSRGNPYYALEIVRALVNQGRSLAPNENLPIPAPISALLRRRLDMLSEAASEVVVLAAASAQPTTSLLQTVTGSTAGLDEALAEGILAADGERVRFTHPLLASVAYNAAPAQKRRGVHRRLAAAARGREEGALHLALGTRDPDEQVSSELDAAAEAAAVRGAPSAAAQLLEQAIRLTPANRPDDQRGRLAAAAEYHYAAGDQERSRSILETLAEELPAGTERARVLAQLSQRVEYELDGLELCRRGLGEAGDDPVLKATLHFYCAASARRAATLPEAAEHARLAVAFAAEGGDDVQRVRALAMLGHVEAMRGESHGIDVLERAVELEAALGEFSVHFRPSFLLGITLLYLSEFERARPLLEAQLDRATDHGDEVMRGVALSTLAELELRSGNWSQAHRLASAGASLQEQAAPLQDQGHHMLRIARVAAHLGRVDEARPLAARLLELAPLTGDRSAEIGARRDLGFMELSLGNPAATVELLEPAVRLLTTMGVGLFSAYPLVQDYVEALVALGQLDSAEQANALLEGNDRPWETAMRSRGRALIAAGRGEYAEAQAEIGRALAAHELLEEPFELGRTLLVQGSLERRAKRRAAARRTLAQALELFDALGAALWAERTASELARIPGRSRASGELTETERRVAELVTQGLSNKEVAARLFVTVRTVEANLSKVYAKLGIRSRTELARRL